MKKQQMIFENEQKICELQIKLELLTNEEQEEIEKTVNEIEKLQETNVWLRREEKTK